MLVCDCNNDMYAHEKSFFFLFGFLLLIYAIGQRLTENYNCFSFEINGLENLCCEHSEHSEQWQSVRYNKSRMEKSGGWLSSSNVVKIILLTY